MADNFQLPANSRVLSRSVSRLTFLKQEFRVFKIYDEIKKNDYQLTFDKEGKQVDFSKLLDQERKLYSEKYGKIHPTLMKKMEGAGPNTPFDVMLWLTVKDEEPLKTSFKETELEKMSLELSRFRKITFRKTTELSEKLAKDNGLKIEKVSAAAPVAFARLTKDQIGMIQANPLVKGVSFYDPKGIDDLLDSLQISNADHVISGGVTGKGVKVAVWEGGPDVTTNLSIAAFKQAGNRSSDHARLVCGIIKNKENNQPHGYAPDCELFSANDDGLDGLEWAVDDKGCSVINQSFHREDEQTDSALSSDDIFKDYMIVHYPYPTIIQAAGNKLDGDGRATGVEYVNHKGYNSLAVGSHDDSAGAMATSSIFRNPSSSHGDRELPEISANGTGLNSVGLTKSGTSFASPAVVGSVALLQSIDGILKIWPEGSRALLLAGATRNVRGATWNVDRLSGVDARDGAGALNIEESGKIAGSRKANNNIASRRGWDIGRLDSNSFGRDRNSLVSYKIKVPSRGAKHVKVALTWNSQVFDFWFWEWSRLEMDLDLWILDDAGNLVATSSSYDNSYEIAEFDGKPGKEYTVKIRKFSGNDWSYFGLAWTVF